MGTKENSEKTVTEISVYLQQEHVQQFNYSLRFNDSLIDSLSAPKYALDTYKLARNTPQSTIQIRIYDSLGKLVNGYAQCYGDFKRLNILKRKDFVRFTQLPNNTSLLFQNEADLWEVDAADRTTLEYLATQRKYTIVAYWNVWSNYYSKVILKELNRYRRNFDPDETETLIILVNTDRTKPTDGMASAPFDDSHDQSL